jgi:hypothetical protein
MKPRAGPRLLQLRTRWPHRLRIRPDCCHSPWWWAQGKPSTVLRTTTPSSPAQPRPLPMFIFSHAACLHWTKHIAAIPGHGAARQRAVARCQLEAVSWCLILQMTSAQRIQCRLPRRQAASLFMTWTKASSLRYSDVATPPARLHLVSYIRSSYLMPQINSN